MTHCSHPGGVLSLVELTEPGYEFTVDWFSANLPAWETHVRPLAGEMLEVLELGCFEGRASV